MQDCQRGRAFRGTVGVNEPISRSSLDKRLTGFIEKLCQCGILGRAFEVGAKLELTLVFKTSLRR